MKINQNALTLDIKVQDKFRQQLADLANGDIQLSCVVLGDSDIDYEISQDMTNARILNAPFNVEAVKYPLIFDGPGGGMKGYVTCFARKVDQDGNISSLYDYPTTDTFTAGQLPPKLENGKDFPSLAFDGTKMGYVLFFQTVLYNFIDSDTQQLMRVNEKINMAVTFNGDEIVPDGWQVTKDENIHIVTLADSSSVTVYNNSMLLGKDIGGSASQNALGVIKVTGALSNLTKHITFNL